MAAARYTQGQRHDRIEEAQDDGRSEAKSAARLMDQNISLSQKMMSAVTGSLLTSLLGKKLCKVGSS